MNLTDSEEFDRYDENAFPLAYLITVRTYATWLHGDPRGSVARDGRNYYGQPRIRPNPALEAALQAEAAGASFTLNREMRQIVEASFRSLCHRRGYGLSAVNARTEHAHAVIAANIGPQRLADALKAEATKNLRRAGLVGSETRVWSRGRSRRYLWKPVHVRRAIHYVLYCQDDRPFDPDVYLEEAEMPD
jgi:REP element-mobilizing transposase RayT